MAGGGQRIPAARGNVLDATGHYLVVSAMEYRIGLSPDMLGEQKDRESLIPQVVEILQLDQDTVHKALMAKGVSYISLTGPDLYSPDQARAIRDLKEGAFNVEPNAVRIYPENALAAAVLGFVVVPTGQGQYGTEEYYDAELRGVDGAWQGVHGGSRLVTEYDAYRPPQNGADLVLTLDRNIQLAAETFLREGIEQNQAMSGNLVVLDPKTGAIKAMASWPTYSPHDYGYVENADVYINPTISAPYEPGSVFKPLTLAAALEERVIRPTDSYDDRGEIIVGSLRIRNSDKKAHGETTMTQLLAYSLNVGAAHVASLLGPTRFCTTIRKFGFSEVTGVDMAREAPGTMRAPGHPYWHMSDLGANSFGQGLLVTPLQIVAAFGAMANDGVLMRPFVASEIRNGDTVIRHGPFRVRRVLSPEVAQQITQLMADAVDLGLQHPLVPGYRFAAKSGTSEIATDQGYQDKDVVASFVGYGPLPDPRFVILVKYDRPKEGTWGAEVAAPVFGKMAKYLVDYYGIPPAYQQARADASR